MQYTVLPRYFRVLLRREESTKIFRCTLGSEVLINLAFGVRGAISWFLLPVQHVLSFREIITLGHVVKGAKSYCEFDLVQIKCLVKNVD